MDAVQVVAADHLPVEEVAVHPAVDEVHQVVAKVHHGDDQVLNSGFHLTLKSNYMPNSNRGLASASEETRKHVASMGGKARAEQRGRNQNGKTDGGTNRGFSSTDESKQKEISREGGKSGRNNSGNENGFMNRGRSS